MPEGIQVVSDKKTKETNELDLAIKVLEKQFGKGIIQQFSVDYGALPGVDWTSTGTLSIDRAIGRGIPEGRIIEIYGPESSGKTTLALEIMAQFQEKYADKKAAIVDAEHALDVTYAEALGVNIPNVLISQPDCGEDALQIVEMLARSNGVSVIVVDSVAALVPRKELEGDMGDHHIGTQARLMSQAMRKLTATISKTGTTLIFINQTRMKIGVMFGNPETTTGGNALKFYASVRIRISGLSGKTKDGFGQFSGREVRVNVQKNKVAPPFRTAEVVIKFGEGIDSSTDLLRLGVEKNIISKSGAWYKYDGESVGQGESAAVEWLREQPEVQLAVREAVLGG